jgi:hypothetical protein
MSLSSSSSTSDKLGVADSVGGKDDRRSGRAGLVGGGEIVGGNSAIGEIDGVT